jgi:plasmid stabilization system protein ParE
MTEIQIGLAESAIGDLEGIREWYQDHGVPEVGERLILEIFERIETLAEHPEIGRIVPELGQAFLR